MGRVVTASSFSGTFRELKRPSSSNVVLLLAIATLLVPALEPWITPHDGRFLIYPYAATVDFIAVIVCLVGARRRNGIDRAAWGLLGCHLAMYGAGFAIASSEAIYHFPNTITGTMLVNVTASAASIFGLFALAVGDPDTNGLKRFLDVVMAVVLGVLIFLTVFAKGPEGFTTYHLQMTVAIGVFLMLCAFAAQQAAETPERERFTSIVVTYLVARVVMLLLINIVHIFWLTKVPNPFFDVFFGFAPIVFVMSYLRSTWRIRIPRHMTQRMVARTALPTAVLVASITLGVWLSTQYHWVCAIGILVCVMCFVLRTQLLYQALFDQQNTLQTQASTMEQWALLDHLTNIGNRRYLEQRTAEILCKPDCRAALLLLDTDFFKEINDTLGHAEGDKLLINIANMLKQEIEATGEGICARIGGDEFAVLLPGSDADRAMAIAEGLRMSFVSLPLYEEMHPTVSIGVALADGPITLTMLLGHADSALYQSKENGRDRVELATYPAA